eukprot:scaffold18993_cov66-Phaeocystis_antarctica.AAC.2
MGYTASVRQRGDRGKGRRRIPPVVYFSLAHAVRYSSVIHVAPAAVDLVDLPDDCTSWCWSGLPCCCSPRGRVPRHPANHEHTRAHIASVILVHVGVSQSCRARNSVLSCPQDEESPTLPTTNTHNLPAGRWMKVQGLFKGEHTLSAWFSYTLVFVSVAVPDMWSPPPFCQP